MNKKITVIKGDGIGSEIIDEAIKVLDKIALCYGHQFEYTYVEVGGIAIDHYGIPLPQASLDACLSADAVLLGAVGGPKWDNQPSANRPEKALLAIRKEMGLYSNIRIAKVFDCLKDASPLKQSIVEAGIDILIVRELIGGVYFGKHETIQTEKGTYASDIMGYYEDEIRRVGKIAFETASKRRRRVTSVDKANVLDSSVLWRKIMHELAKDYPDIEYSDMLVDNAAMQLVKNPSQFDVIVTENMFGDILSDEASMISGSIGLIPSSSLGDNNSGMYEPIHGSAPDIVGKNIANPIGTILSASMMLKYSFDMGKESKAIEDAVSAVLQQGYRCADLTSGDCLSCSEMGQIIANQIKGDSSWK